MNETDLQKQQRKIDQTIGYCIMAFLTLVLVSLIAYGFFRMKNPDKIKIAVFETTGNLKIEDPVFLKGIEVGKIKNIDLQSYKVLVSFTSRIPLNLHQGYSVDIMDVGIMGDRMISIDFGDTAKPLINETDTLVGVFHEGLSGGIGMAWKLHSVVDSFMNMTAKLLKGTPGHASLVQQINEIMKVTDSTSKILEAALGKLSVGLSGGLDTLNHMINEISSLAHTADSLGKQKLPNWKEQMGNLEKGLEKFETLADGLIVVVEKLDQMDNSDKNGKMASFLNKIKEMRDAIIHIKQEFVKLQKLSLKPT
jgi:ABC-type transporter Mla subunit MlaD